MLTCSKVSKYLPKSSESSSKSSNKSFKSSNKSGKSSKSSKSSNKSANKSSNKSDKSSKSKSTKRLKLSRTFPDDLWGLIFSMCTNSLEVWRLLQTVNQQFRRCALKARALSHLDVFLPTASLIPRLGPTLPGVHSLWLGHVEEDLPLCLENLTGLRHLTLALPEGPDMLWRPRADINDNRLSTVCNLKTLQTLKLDGCLCVSDVTHLSRLTQLRELSLSHSQVSDLEPLTPLPLTKLTLDNNSSLTDLSALAHMFTLHHLSLSRCDSLPDKALKSLVGLKQLRTMDLSFCTSLTVDGLCTLSDLTGLKELDFTDTRADDEVLHVLCRSLELESLQLCGCDITDVGLRNLASQRSLRYLNLEGCQSISNLGPLEKLVSLLELDLYDCQDISDQSLVHLSGLVRLQKLDLRFTDITEAGLSALRPLAELRDLDLSPDMPMSDVGLQAIGQLSSLRELRLCKSISDAGLEALSRLTGIRTLDLSGCGVADKGLRAVASLSALHTLNLSGLQITDAGLSELAQLKALSSVDLSDCNLITMGGVWELRGLLGLSTLKLAGCMGIYWLACGLPHFARLQELDLRRTRLRKLDASLFTALETLDVSSCTTYFVEHLGSLQPPLTVLRMSGWKPIGSLTLSPLLQFSQLQTLDLSNSSHVNDQHVRVLASLPLFSLKLDRCEGITDESLLALASCSTLGDLDVSECDLITDAGLQFLSGSKLMFLNCSACDRVTAVGLKALPPKLQVRANDCFGLKESHARIVPRVADGSATLHPSANRVLHLSLLAFSLRTPEPWFTVEEVEDGLALFRRSRPVEDTAMYVKVEFGEVDWEFIAQQFADPVQNVHRRWYFFKDHRDRSVRVHARPVTN